MIFVQVNQETVVKINAIDVVKKFNIDNGLNIELADKFNGKAEIRLGDNCYYSDIPYEEFIERLKKACEA